MQLAEMRWSQSVIDLFKKAQKGDLDNDYQKYKDIY